MRFDPFRHFRRKRKSYGLNKLDLKLLPYLPKQPGFFIEAGANDGISQSNTLYLERYLGWRGLLVEPIPEAAVLCRQRRGSIVEQCALVPFEYDAPTVELRYGNLMSVVTGAMSTADEEDAHIESACRVQNIETYSFKAPARTLSSLLDKHGITNVDLLVLDVEGSELPVLRGLDLNRHLPELMLIESRFRAEIDEYLSGKYDTVAELTDYSTHQDVLYRAI